MIAMLPIKLGTIEFLEVPIHKLPVLLAVAVAWLSITAALWVDADTHELFPPMVMLNTGNLNPVLGSTNLGQIH